MSNPSVAQQKLDALYTFLETLGVNKNDIVLRAITGSSKGGQKQNSTQNCIQLHYPPENITIKCHRSRSRRLNEYYALKSLSERLAKKQNISTPLSQKSAKLKKQKQRRKRRQQKRDAHDTN
jgi:protein subunit release factor B